MVPVLQLWGTNSTTKNWEQIGSNITVSGTGTTPLANILPSI